MAQTFAAFVDEWAKASEARLLAVFKRAVELLADELRTRVEQGGRTPWDTGNMVRSLMAEVNGVVQTSDGPFTAPGDVEAKVALMQMGDRIMLGFQANYARRQNYGFVGQDSMGRNYNQSGKHFIEHAASLWPTMVELAHEELKSLSS